jgi:hypothetical protein
MPPGSDGWNMNKLVVTGVGGVSGIRLALSAQTASGAPVWPADRTSAARLSRDECVESQLLSPLLIFARSHWR